MRALAHARWLLLATAFAVLLGWPSLSRSSTPRAAEPGAGEDRSRDRPPARVGEVAAGPRTEDEPPAPAADDVAQPAALLQLPAEESLALVADLQRNRLHLVAGQSRPTVIESFYVSFGKNGSNKRREGDEKTPIGIYFITQRLPDERLPSIYGAGALPLSYPNVWDRRLGRTGSGIWIHGTDSDEALPPRSSRGCLALANHDFRKLARVVELRRTPVVISDRVDWAQPSDLEADRRELATAIEAWRRDWESLETEAYLAHYSADFRTASMSRGAWVRHKRRVNAGKRFIRVELHEIGLYRYPGEPGLVLATFRQDYSSSNFSTSAWKQQFWRRERDAWRIVHEGRF